MKQRRNICNSMKKRVNPVNLIIRESIETALIELMKRKPFNEITITEIVKKAGVSRISYYRNYYLKEDVLFARMDKIAAEWKEKSDNEQGEISEKMIRLFESERPVLEVLYKNGLEHLLYKLIRKYCGLEENIENNGVAYLLSFWAGAFFGWCDEWAKRGMQETPEQIIEMFQKTQNDQKNNPENPL